MQSSELPNRIREFRERRGLSQQALADAVGASKPQIDKLEKGQRRLTDAWMRRIAPALGCTPRDLLPLSDTPPKETVLLDLFRNLSETEQDQLIRIATALAEPEVKNSGVGSKSSKIIGG